ncbi:MAG: hypothetical protein U5K56_21595 [Halioglobus sp.]|nr:hypothetical protein [Halioglobus sp.]
MIKIDAVGVHFASLVGVAVAVAEHQRGGIQQVLARADGKSIDLGAAGFAALVAQVDNPAAGFFGDIARVDGVVLQVEILHCAVDIRLAVQCECGQGRGMVDRGRLGEGALTVVDPLQESGAAQCERLDVLAGDRGAGFVPGSLPGLLLRSPEQCRRTERFS